MNLDARSAETPPYLAVILDQPVMGPEWKSWLTHELALRGILLGMEGAIEEGGTLLGFFRFLDRDETEAVLREMNVEVEARSCPWAGPVRGAIGWVRAGLQEQLLSSFLPLLVRLGQGPFVRTADAAHYAPIRKAALPLSHLVEKHGFEDGEALLRLTPDYLENARREVQFALERAGLEAQVSLIETAHNPLRIRGPVLRDGKEVPSQALRKLSVSLWVYDRSLLRDVMFW
jgi:hypothetical protein